MAQSLCPVQSHSLSGFISCPSPHHSLPSGHPGLLALTPVKDPPFTEALYLFSLPETCVPDNLVTCPRTSRMLKYHLLGEASPDGHISISPIHQRFPFPYLTFCFMFFYKALIATWNSSYLFIVISVFLSPIDCKLHKAGIFVLFTFVSPVPRTVHSDIYRCSINICGINWMNELMGMIEECFEN